MAYCPGCAHNNPDAAAFCAACGMSLPGAAYGAGAPPPYPQANPYGQQPYGQQPYGMPPPGYGMGPGYSGQTRTSGMAIAGFVLSFFCALLGLIFSIIGYNECKNSGGAVTGGGLALAGIIISIVNMVVGIMIAAAS
jgi:hypothetical protein